MGGGTEQDTSSASRPTALQESVPGQAGPIHCVVRGPEVLVAPSCILRGCIRHHLESRHLDSTD